MDTSALSRKLHDDPIDKPLGKEILQGIQPVIGGCLWNVYWNRARTSHFAAWPFARLHPRFASSTSLNQLLQNRYISREMLESYTASQLNHAPQYLSHIWLTQGCSKTERGQPSSIRLHDICTCLEHSRLATQLQTTESHAREANKAHKTTSISLSKTSLRPLEIHKSKGVFLCFLSVVLTSAFDSIRAQALLCELNARQTVVSYHVAMFTKYG